MRRLPIYILGLLAILALYAYYTPGGNLGAISFPTSLDIFTNPSASDSVATVSHSSQHSNTNDALEVLQAKLGITASTPIGGSILAGNGAGSSIWTTFATTTNLQSTNILAVGSSTLQNFTFINATGTSATTTNSFSSIASSTNLFGTNINGFSLTTCSGSQFLQWSGGRFGCTTPDVGGVSSFSTTTSVQLATTTIHASELPTTDHLQITMESYMEGSASTTARMIIAFNYESGGDLDRYASLFDIGGSTGGSNNQTGFARLMDNVANARHDHRYLNLELLNVDGVPKAGDYSLYSYSTTTTTLVTVDNDSVFRGGVVSATTTKISSIAIWFDVPNAFFAKGTVIKIFGY